MGTVPPKAINHSAITRPLSLGARRDCKMVSIEVVVTRYAMPRKNPTINACRGVRESAKSKRVTAKEVKPNCTTLRLSELTKMVPIARPPNAAPKPQVAYNQR